MSGFIGSEQWADPGDQGSPDVGDWLTLAPEIDPDDWERRHTRVVLHSCGHVVEWICKEPDAMPAEWPEPCPSCAPCPLCKQKPCACPDPFADWEPA